ncbi:hypothetical protein PUN28_003412 [Cardiocondyla obscurior]|uniref:Uncharacterized protein n=1 Tax=Cardiocondyla obscurior TaxID=286306 RepID=A0AAW2GN25_9HYME
MYHGSPGSFWTTGGLHKRIREEAEYVLIIVVGFFGNAVYFRAVSANVVRGTRTSQRPERRRRPRIGILPQRSNQKIRRRNVLLVIGRILLCGI